MKDSDRFMSEVEGSWRWSDPGFDAGVPVVHQRVPDVWSSVRVLFSFRLDFGVWVSSETVFNEAALMNVLSLAAGLRVLLRFQVPGSRFQISFFFDELEILDPSFLDVFVVRFSCKFPVLAASGWWFVFIKAVDYCCWGYY